MRGFKSKLDKLCDKVAALDATPEELQLFVKLVREQLGQNARARKRDEKSRLAWGKTRDENKRELQAERLALRRMKEERLAFTCFNCKIKHSEGIPLADDPLVEL